MKPILVIDIGNTHASLARYRKGRVRKVRRVPSTGTSLRAASAAVIDVMGEAVTGLAVLATVVPADRATWDRVLCNWDRHWVSHQSPLGIPISYAKPETIGVDRLVNAGAAARLHGVPVVVADLGTALTVEAVVTGRGFIGGVIAPGLRMGTDFLASRTAQLPEVKAGPGRRVIGRSTEQAIRSGAWHGYRGAVREILLQVREEAGGESVTLCATGGDAKRVLKDIDLPVAIEPHLTLIGLGFVGETVFSG
jgi:type III pantothenate kinase